MNSLVSICIPTYNRPDLLKQAVLSALDQTYTDIEIIISDDSSDDLSEIMLMTLGHSDKIRYYHNQPALKQASNVNQLFDLAQGDRLVLLHDDDLLLPTAIEDMLNCWQDHPDLVVCFGKQYIINMQGELLERASQKLNQDYYRIDNLSGLQTSSLWSAILGQMPNDGFMVLTQAAQEIRCRNEPQVGNICDYDFNLRLAEKYDHFFFLNKYTSSYRLTEISISSENNNGNLSYQLIESLQLSPDLEPARTQRLKGHAASAINQWLLLGDRASALKVYTSQYYAWSQRLSLQGILQAVLLACPFQLGTLLSRLLKALKKQVKFA